MHPLQATSANTKDTKFILHSVTSVSKAKINRDKKGQLNDQIADFNKYVQNRIKEWTRLDVYLDFWKYDLALSAVKGCRRDDGLHFERWCNYQPLITQWDFNWLLHLNVISDGDTVVYNKATN